MDMMKCEKCGKEFKNDLALKIHVGKQHGKGRKAKAGRKKAVRPRKTAKGALVWVASPRSLWDDDVKITVTWPGGPTRARFRCYDTKKGEWFAEGSAVSEGGAFTISFDRSRSSVAVIMEAVR